MTLSAAGFLMDINGVTGEKRDKGDPGDASNTIALSDRFDEFFDEVDAYCN